jgi:hypothetical protein
MCTHLVVLTHLVDLLCPLAPFETTLDALHQLLRDARGQAIRKVVLIPVKGVVEDIAVERAQVGCLGYLADCIKIIVWDGERLWLPESDSLHVESLYAADKSKRCELTKAQGKLESSTGSTMSRCGTALLRGGNRGWQRPSPPRGPCREIPPCNPAQSDQGPTERQ